MTKRTIMWMAAAGALAVCGSGAAAQTPVSNFPLAWCVHGPEEAGINFADVPIQRGKAVIFYEQSFGKSPRVYIHPQTGQGYVENEGIPQRTNWPAHLAEVARDINVGIPDPNWEGYAILDYESWHPNWDLFSNEYMKTMSRDWVRARFPGLTEAQVEARAHEEFEAAGMDFLIRTLQECKRLRPRAMWGYYGYPYYYPAHLQEEFRPLFNAVDAFYPDVYACNYSVPDAQIPQPGQKRVGVYIADMEGKMDIARTYAPTKPIYPFVWMRYHEMNGRYGGQFINDLDLSSMFRVPWRAGVKGAIFWDVIRTAEERDGYNALFAGRGGQFFREFMAEVSPPPAATPPPPTNTASPQITRLNNPLQPNTVKAAPAKPGQVRTVTAPPKANPHTRTATAPTE